jgi:hypothetical protein
VTAGYRCPASRDDCLHELANLSGQVSAADLSGRGFATTAIEQGELPASEDPERLAFELNGIILAADTNFVLHDDPAVLDLARQIVHQRLGTRDGRPD